MFLTSLIENRLCDDEVIFHEDKASCHRAKSVQAFLWERHINSMTLPANSPDPNPNENLWWKAYLSNVIQENWSKLDGEYHFSSVKSVPQRIQAAIKAQGYATKY